MFQSIKQLIQPFHFFFCLLLALFFDLRLFIFVVEVADGVLEFEEAFVSDLKRSGDILAVLHRAEIKVLEGSERVFRVDSVEIHQDRDLLVLLVLVALKDVQEDLSVLFVGLHLVFFVA